MKELVAAETYWLSISQHDHFAQEIDALQKKHMIHNSSCLLPLHPLVDSSGLLRVGGREQNSNAPYSSQLPVILHGKHPVAKLLIQSEYLHLLHTGPKLLTSSLSCRFHCWMPQHYSIHHSWMRDLPTNLCQTSSSADGSTAYGACDARLCVQPSWC